MSHLLDTAGHVMLVPDIVRAENCHLWDREGNRYVDLESGVWCTSIGHGHPRIRRVVAEQMASVAHLGFGYGAAVVEEAACELLALAGFENGACVFLCSGSEAVEYAVRVARSVTTAPLLMTLNDSYFGAYGAASDRREEAWYGFDWLGCPRCRDPHAVPAECPHWRAVPFERIGGFLFEPGSSSGLVRFPPRALIDAIAGTVRAADGLLMVNEVTTGVGRTGRWFGFQHYGLAPDIIALGKGIGNGYPVSATLLSARTVERLARRPMHYAQSHQNDPLGAAVAREVVRVIDEQALVERGAGIGRRIHEALDALARDSGRIAALRGRGPMIAIELADGPDAAVTTAVHHALAREGFLVGRRPGLPVLRIDPGLTIEIDDVDRFAEAMARVLARAPAGP